MTHFPQGLNNGFIDSFLEPDSQILTSRCALLKLDEKSNMIVYRDHSQAQHKRAEHLMPAGDSFQTPPYLGVAEHALEVASFDHVSK